jgi:uncharacterized delta-60 repeat protein
MTTRFLAFAAALLLPLLAIAQPTITTQPTNATLSSGNNLVLSVAATGTGTLTYQWLKETTALVNGGSISGATSNRLQITNAQVADSGSYSVKVTDSGGETPSVTVTATISEVPLKIFGQSPGVVFSNVGGAARLFVNTNSDASQPVVMQWKKRVGATVTSPTGPFYGSSVGVVDLTNVKNTDFGVYTLEFSTPFGPVVSEPIELRENNRGADPLLFWSGRNPSPQPNSLFSIAFGPSSYVAVGASGAILTSTDSGATWQSQLNGFQHALNGVFYDSVKQTFLYGGGFTQLATSTNGSAWSPVAFPGVNGSFPGIASNGLADPNHRLVAVGGDFSSRAVGSLIRVSADGGATWTTPTVPGGNPQLNKQLASVAFGLGRFVAVGAGGRILTSDSTAATWTDATVSAGTQQNFNRVVFANGVFVAVGNAANTGVNAVLYTSTNGETFTARVSASAGRNIFAVAHISGNKWVAATAAIVRGGAAAAAPANYLVSNDNGVTWTSETAPTPTGVHINDIAVEPGANPRVFLVGNAGYIAHAPASAFPGALTQVSGSVLSTYADFLNDVVYDSTSSQFIAVSGSSHIVTSPNGDTWSQRSAPGTLGFATATARIGSRLLVSGSRRIAYSDDNAATWTDNGTDLLTGTDGFRGVAATTGANALAVAVGTSGKIFTSTDGASWTPRNSGTTSILQKVAHANGRWIAVGGNDEGGSSIVILTSDDGITWTPRPAGTNGQLWGVDYGDGVWLAAGAASSAGNGGFVLRSTDNGETWERLNLDGTAFLYKVRYLHGVWYAVGANGVLAVSRNHGEDWAYIPLPARSVPSTIRGMAIGSRSMVLVGNDGIILKSGSEVNAAPVIYRQPSSATFAQAGGEVTLSVEANNALQGTYQWRKNGADLVNGGNVSGATSPNLRLSNVTAADSAVYDVVVTNGNAAPNNQATSTTARVVVSPPANDTFPNFVFRSPVPAGGSLYGVIHDGARFVAVGTGGRVVTSANGESWTQRPGMPTDRARAIVFNGTTYFAAGSGRIFTSTNVETGPWTERATSAPASGWFNGLAYSGTNYVAVGDSGLIFSSTDSGATWAVRTAPAEATGAFFRAIAVSSTGRFVAVGGNGAVVTSTNAIDWSVVTPPAGVTTAQFNAVAFVNGQFIVAGNSGALMTSSTGEAGTWARVVPPASYGFTTIAYDGARYLFADGGGTLIRAAALTSNQADWTTFAMPTALRGTPFFGLAFDASNPRRYVQVGAGGEIWLSTDGAAAQWTPRGSHGGIYRFASVQYNGESFVAVGSNGNVLISDDGHSWQRYDLGTGHWLTDFKEGNGRVVVTTEFGDLISVADSVPTTLQLGDNVRNNSIVYGAGRFVIVGDGGRTRTSSDGFAWTTTDIAGVTQNLTSVLHFKNLFVAVGQGGRIVTSPDGTTWTTRISNTTQNLHRLRAIDGVLYAVGDNRTILTSADGLAWSALPSPSFTNSYDIYGFAYRDIAKLHDGYYIASSQGILIKTRDFVGYSRVAQLASREDLSSMAVGAGRIVISGMDGGALLSSTLPQLGSGLQIAVQPRPSNTVNAGNNVVLTVVAHAPEALNFQWKKNGVVIPGATGATLFLPATTPLTSGTYTVDVWAGTGTPIVSAPAVVTIIPADGSPVIVDQPRSMTVAAGGPAGFTVGVRSNATTPAFTYQWFKGSTPLEGETFPQIFGRDVALEDADTFRVDVTSNGVTVSSAPATLTVVPTDNVLFQHFTDTGTENSPARTVHHAGKIYTPWSVQERISDIVAGRFIGALARFDETTGALDPAFRLDPRIRNVTHVVPESATTLLIAARVGDASTLYRVNLSGQIDTGFTAPLFARPIRFFARQADGKVIVPVTEVAFTAAPAGALGADSARVFRLNANGTRDTTYPEPALVNANGIAVNLFGPPVIDSGNRVYLTGVFTAINGTGRASLARLNADGSLDTAFAATLPTGFVGVQGRGVALQADGRAIFVGNFRWDARGTINDPVMAIRFNTDGTFDQTFAMPLRTQVGIDLTRGQWLRHLVVLPDNSFVAVSDKLYRFFGNGVRDTTFVSRLFGREAFWFSRGADGRFFVPDIPTVQGEVAVLPNWVGGIARFDSNGTPEPFPTGGWGRVAYPTSGAPLANGRVWVAGAFNRFGPTYVPGVALFNLNGTLAGTQAQSELSMTAGTVAATDNDKVFAWIETASNTTETQSARLVRLNADATVDPTFAPPANLFGALHASPGGKLLLAQSSVGATAALNNTVGNVLRRLNADGSIDTTYSPTLSSIAVVERNATTNAVTMIRTGGLNIAQVLPDSRALIVASSIDGTLKVQRLTATGDIDSTFTAPSFGTITPTTGFTLANTVDPVTNTTGQLPVSTYSAADLVRAAVQLPNGKVYVGGRFALGGSAPFGLVRLNTDGTLDTSFTGAGIANSNTDAVPYVSALTVDAAGRVYVAGRFTSFNGTAVPGLFRLTPEGALDTTWNPGFGIRDVPVAAARLVIAHGKLFAFGTAGNAGDLLPAPFRYVDISETATAPTVASVTPAAPRPGSTITLSGANLASTTEVRFNTQNGTLAGTFTYNAGDQQLVVTVPSAARSGPLQVLTSGGAATFNLNVPLVVTGYAQHAIVTPGQAINLFVTVAGGAPGTYSYQWRRDGQAISGATGPGYYVPSMGTANVGNYDVQVSVNAEQILAGPIALRLADPGRWAWQNRLPTSNDLRGVAFGAGKYVAVGLGGTLVNSSNGTTWVAQPQRPPLGLNDIFFNGSQFVAVGFGGNVLVSGDGENWTETNVGDGTTLAGVTFGHGKWVIVGTGGSIYTATSPTGLWVRQALPNTETINDIVPTANGFVAVASNGFVHLGNPAAAVWTTSRPAWDGATATSLFDVAVKGSTVVASGARRVYVSSDNGQTWTNATLPSAVSSVDLGVDWSGVIADPTDGFIVVGGSFPNTPGVVDPRVYVISSPDGSTWTTASFAALTPGLGAIAKGTQGYVAVGAVGQVSRAATFTDAWTSHSSGRALAGGLFGVASSPNESVAVGSVGTVFRSTSHLGGWTDFSIGNDFLLQSVIRASGRFVAVGGNNNSNAGAGVSAIYTSTDGAAGNWTHVELAGPSLLTAVAFDAIRGRFVAAGFGNQIYSATDPAGTWTPVAKPVNRAIRAATAGNGTYLLVGDNGAIFRSTDGTSWSESNSGTTVQLAAAGYGAGRFVAAGFDNINNLARTVIVRSEDGGQTWQNIPVPYTGSIRAITFADGRFWLVGGTSTVLSSTDGLNWTANTSQFSGVFRGIARTPRGLVAVGDSGAIATLEAPSATVAVASRTITAGTAIDPVFTPVTASGGFEPYVFTVPQGLPTGLSMTTANGQVSGTPTVATAVAAFVGADDFRNGFAQWPVDFRITPGTNGNLLLANNRLEFSKGTGAGSAFREWDGDPTSASTRTTASFATSWVAEITAANNAVTQGGEFVSLGLEVSGGPTSYSTLILGVNGSIRAEGTNTAPVDVSGGATSGVRLRLAWNATTRQLVASYSINGGASYTDVKTFAPATEWPVGSAEGGFFFHVFGNSNASAAISGGTVYADDFSLHATSVTTNLHTVIVGDRSGLTARGTFALLIQPPSTGAIVAVTPTVASAGQTVTITGAGFTGATAVAFNGAAATFTVLSPTQIRAIVPVAASSGPVTVTTPGGTLTAGTDFTVPGAAPLMNLSHRGVVGTGENALLANFTLEGTGTRSVLIRGVGPTLATFGVNGVVSDPELKIYNERGEVVGYNDDWSTAGGVAEAAGQVGAFALATGSKDAALRLDLAPGTYTARVTGVGNTTGIALVEIYLQGDTATPRLTHVAARGRVAASESGSTGFFLSGTAPRTVLLRAVGTPLVPALGALTDPVLTVFQGQNQIGTNDNWTASSELTAATTAAGAMPLAATDAALLLTLEPGAYTVTTSGANGASGFVLTEVFLIDGNLAPSFKPALLAPIADRTVRAGTSVTFNAPTLAKPFAVTYEWRRGSTVVTGAGAAETPSALVLLNPTPADSGTYSVKLTNSAGFTDVIGWTLNVLARHSSDYAPADGFIGVEELTRTVALYNTRNGTVRTGAYGADAASADGFAPDATRSPSGSVTPANRHSADTDNDGAISLFELTRVIELYNYRNAGVRTGQYRVDGSSEDGFAPGP